jgi:hypothetical protein
MIEKARAEWLFSAPGRLALRAIFKPGTESEEDA